MHLSVHTVILFAGLLSAQAPSANVNAPLDAGLASINSIVNNLGNTISSPASPTGTYSPDSATTSPVAIPNTISAGSSTGGASIGSMATPPSAMKNSAITTSFTTNPAAIVNPSSSMSNSSGSPGSSSKATSGVASGTSTPSASTNTTAPSSSGTSPKNVAAQLRGLADGAGILLPIAMLAAL